MGHVLILSGMTVHVSLIIFYLRKFMQVTHAVHHVKGNVLLVVPDLKLDDPDIANDFEVRWRNAP